MLTFCRHLYTQTKLLMWRPKSYAQTGEDLILEMIAGPEGIKSYLEIGGCHPVYLSGSYKFYREGARGVIVEPNPVLAKLFKLVRRRDTVLQAAIVAKPRKDITFYRFLSATLNTTDKAEAEAVAKLGYKKLPTLTVPALTPQQIIAKHFPHQAPDYMSLDIEGGEDEILAVWPWDKPNARPRFVVLEIGAFADLGDYDASYAKRVGFMQKQGYKVAACTHVNVIFARTDTTKHAKLKRK